MYEGEFILGWFARHALRPLMCFAAGGQVVDTGGGAGDGGAGGGDEGGGGDDADTTDVDADADADADVDTDDADADADADADVDAEDEETEEEAQARDARRMPDQVKKALAKLRETDPKAADIARKAYYEAGDYKQVFPTVHAARDAADLIENFGGAEGIGALKKDSTDYAAELSDMAKGEPAAVDRLAKDFPQGLVKMAPYAMGKLKDLAPDVYEHHAANIVVESLAQYGMVHSIVRLNELIADGKQVEAKKLAGEMQEWINNTSAFAKSKPTFKSVQAQGDDAVSKERQEFEAQKAEEFRNNAAVASIQALDKLLGKELDRLLLGRKGLKLNKAQRRSFLNEARGHVAEGLGNINGYRDRVASFLQAKDIEGLQRFMRGKALARLNGSNLITKGAREAWKTRGWATGKPAAKGGAGGGGGQGGGAAAMGAKPAAADIDWSKDKTRARFQGAANGGKFGEATLKNGKVVKWKW